MVEQVCELNQGRAKLQRGTDAEAIRLQPKEPQRLNDGDVIWCNSNLGKDESDIPLKVKLVG